MAAAAAPPASKLRRVIEVDEHGNRSPASSVASDPTSSVEALRPRQEIRYVSARDGVHLASATAGNGPPLVKTAKWLNHTEYDWESPVWSPLLGRLAVRNCLLCYDERGTELSDCDVPHCSFAAFIEDLEAAVDTFELERFALFGMLQGAPIGIAHAVRHPRIQSLV